MTREANPWRALEPRYGDGVREDRFRHYLDGRPIHCGDIIELKGVDGAPVPVRYEVTHTRRDGETTIRGLLCKRVGGLEFSRAYDDENDPHLEFRWPRGLGGGS